MRAADCAVCLEWIVSEFFGVGDGDLLGSFVWRVRGIGLRGFLGEKWMYRLVGRLFLCYKLAVFIMSSILIGGRGHVVDC